MSKENTIISLLKEINKNIDNVGGGGNTSKVKVSTLKVTNACINDEGIWEGESLIDTSEIKSLLEAFKNCSKLKSINTNGWDTSKVISLNATFYGTAVESLDLSHWDTSKVTNISMMVSECKQLKNLNTYGWDTSNITSTGRPFNGTFIKFVDFRTWNAGKMSNLTNDANGLFNCGNNLITFIGGVEIDEVIANNVTALKDAKVDIVISNLILIDRASLRALINGLADLTGSDAKTLTLGTTLIAKLTEEDIAIATAKNWTIA